MTSRRRLGGGGCHLREAGAGFAVPTAGVVRLGLASGSLLTPYVAYER